MDRPVMAGRLSAQQLVRRSRGPVQDVVRRLLAVQAQDPRGARLAIRSRTTGLTAADVDAALDDRRLVVSWLNRGTLHLVASEDYWWLHQLTTPQLVTGNKRRLAQEGVDPRQAERGVAVVAEAVADGPRTRAQLRALLAAAKVPTAGQALVHVLMAATLQGHIVRGPMAGDDQAYVDVADWFGSPSQPPDDPWAELARRYLAGHGPADAKDLAKWAGVPLGKARRALDAIAAEVRVRTDGLVDLRTGRRGPATAKVPPRLLGAFDPLLLGWASREQVVGDHRGLVTANGLFRPFALVGGRAVATWGLRGGVVSVRALEPVAARDLAALRTDAVDVLRFLGKPAREPVVENTA